MLLSMLWRRQQASTVRLVTNGTIVRSLGIPVWTLDSTSWQILGSLLRTDTLHRTDIALDARALLKFTESVEDVASRKVRDENFQESYRIERPQILRDEIGRLSQQAQSCDKRSKEGKRKHAVYLGQIGMIERQLKALEEPADEAVEEVEAA